MERVRTCIACRKTADKRSMFRIARTKDGNVRFDRLGNGAGRGAYVCSTDCLQAALKRRRLPQALRGDCPASDLEAIGREIAELEGSLEMGKDEEW